MDTRTTLNIFTVGSVAVMFMMLGCSPKEKKAEHRFIEDTFVEGQCSEDHTTVSSNYQGEIVHWLTIATNIHARYGSVHDFDSLDVEKMSQHIKEPSRYQPPFAIAFSNLSESDIAGSEFTLHGVSEQDDHGGGFNATCKLTVTKRLDHLPTNAERAEIVKRR
jgi:hypothetical protein